MGTKEASTLNPKPYTLNPKPKAQSPKPQTLKPLNPIDPFKGGAVRGRDAIDEVKAARSRPSKVHLGDSQLFAEGPKGLKSFPMQPRTATGSL